MNDTGKLCPSGRCRPGSTLLGIRGPGGRIIYTPNMPPLDEELADAFAANGGSAAYRFAEPCVEHQCGHWSDGTCGVARATVASSVHATDGLPHCSIRVACRWFAQEGRAACYACPVVVRDDPLAAAATAV